jgi:hypothetical protein
MLVGHEVSHALHTPAEGWQKFVGEDGRKHMFLNCVEDARIERMIKSKFPGLRKDFASAYKTLFEQDLFEIAGKDISSLPLIDRLNLEFKLGLFGLVDVPFSADEQQYVTRMDEAETFEEVMTLADELYALQKQEDEKNKPEQVESGEGSPGEGEDGEGQEGTSSNASGEDESEGSGSSGTGEEGDDESDGAGNGEGDESDEDSGASADDDTDDGESADSEDSDSSNGGTPSELNYDDYENNIDAAGSTQRAFERGLEDMRDSNASDFTYRTLPTMNLKHCIVDWKTITEDMSFSYANHSKNDTHNFDETLTENRKNLQAFLNKSRPTVMHMVQQFQMKQAADADKKTEIAKTGVLDTTTMVNYRWSEDIFVKNEVCADGKSHGMVMFVDWSGSMSNIINDTVEQLLVLVEFCRKAGIPYDVYAFSSNQFVHNPKGYHRYTDEYRDLLSNRPEQKQFTVNREDSLQPHPFQLYHYLSSGMNARQYKTALQNFWWITECCCQYHREWVPSHYSLGCTPLNEAVLAAMEIIPEFQRRNGTQIVNTVFLSDGEGHGIGIRGWRSRDRGFLRDQKTQRTYECGHDQGAETYCLIECLKDKTGCNTISIRLHDNKNIKNLRYTFWNDTSVEGFKSFDDACRSYKKDNFVTVDVPGYDEYFIVKGDLKVEFDALENVDDDASLTVIKNAFLKGNTNKKSSRVIANRIVEIIAA